MQCNNDLNLRQETIMIVEFCAVFEPLDNSIFAFFAFESKILALRTLSNKLRPMQG